MIESIGRKSCKKCRFEKCLEVGMKVSFVTGQSKVSRKELLFRDVITFQEENLLKSCFDKGFSACHEKMYDFYEENLDIAQIHFGELNKDQRLSNQELKFNHNLDKFFMRQLALQMIEIDGCNDVCKLYNHNFDQIHEFLHCIVMLDQEFLTEWTLMMLNFGKKVRNQTLQAKLIVDLAEKSLENRVKFNYDHVYGEFWASHFHIEQEHRAKFQSIFQWFNLVKSKNENAGKIVFFLIFLILTYNATGIENRVYSAQAEKNQQKYLSLLLRYLKSISENQDEAYQMFHKGLMLIHETEALKELSKNRLKLNELQDNSLEFIE